MNSQKVKEIKIVLKGLVDDASNWLQNAMIGGVNLADILTLINELESENERLSKELDSEWKDRRKAEENLHKAQWNYKIGLGQSRKRNKELKDRINELEKENKRLATAEAELQELNIKYYNEAKDLRRQLANIEAENKRLSERLGQILLSIDMVKEMNAMCDIDDHRKQAVKEFAEKLKEKCSDYLYHTNFDGKNDFDIHIGEISRINDELLKEYEK